MSIGLAPRKVWENEEKGGRKGAPHPFQDKENKMEDKDVILEAMRKAGEPLNAGKVAELTGLDRKAVDKAFAAMKKTGEIVSPVRCKWEPAKK